MTVKLHIFKGFENLNLGITTDMELGHLYSDEGKLEELMSAGKQLGMREKWLQMPDSGIFHFDLWRTPLSRAKGMFLIVTDEEFASDVEKVMAIPRCGNCYWWELKSLDIVVGHHGACRHPVGEAQHIAFTGQPAPFGLEVPGAMRACEGWEGQQ